MSRKVGLLTVLILAIPIMSRADSQVDFSDHGGSLTGSSQGLSLTGSTLSGMEGYDGGGWSGNLGILSFRTGALISGSLSSDATFAAGGAFSVAGNGSNGLPSGTIFRGTFSGPLTWQLSTHDGTHTYTLSGYVTGTITIGGQTYRVTGAPVQWTINTGTGYFDGRSSDIRGHTTLMYRVPEAGSFSMLTACAITLIGAFGIGLIRRKRTI